MKILKTLLIIIFFPISIFVGIVLIVTTDWNDQFERKYMMDVLRFWK